MPLLWDTKTHEVVSNDSWQICKLLAGPLAPLGDTRAELAPAPLAERMEEVHGEIYGALLNGVYKAKLLRNTFRDSDIR